MSSRYNKKTTELNALRKLAKLLYTELVICNLAHPKETGNGEKKYWEHLKKYPQPAKKLPNKIAYEDL